MNPLADTKRERSFREMREYVKCLGEMIADYRTMQDLSIAELALKMDVAEEELLMLETGDGYGCFLTTIYNAIKFIVPDLKPFDLEALKARAPKLK